MSASTPSARFDGVIRFYDAIQGVGFITPTKGGNDIVFVQSTNPTSTHTSKRETEKKNDKERKTKTKLSSSAAAGPSSPYSSHDGTHVHLMSSGNRIDDTSACAVLNTSSDTSTCQLRNGGRVTYRVQTIPGGNQIAIDVTIVSMPISAVDTSLAPSSTDGPVSSSHDSISHDESHRTTCPSDCLTSSVLLNSLLLHEMFVYIVHM